MILRHSVTIQTKTTSKGNEGEQIATWTTLKTIFADVQPNSLNPVEAKAWGITDLTANSQKMFYKHDDTIQVLMRVIYEGKTYEIRNVNSWRIHNEAILIPVQGI